MCWVVFGEHIKSLPQQFSLRRILLKMCWVVLGKQYSAQLLFFRNLSFWKIYVWTNYEIDKNVFIFKRMRLRENCIGKDILCSLITTQHKFCFLKIWIFENYILKQNSKWTKMYLFSKRCVWEKIVEEEVYCARLEQLRTTFVFSKKQNGHAGKNIAFQNFGSNFNFF